MLLHPDIGYYAGISGAYRARVIGEAERYTRRMLPSILASLRAAGIEPLRGRHVP